MPELVIDGALFCVAQDLVRLLGFLEFVLRLRVVGIAIRMIFHGEAAIRLLDVRFGGRSGHIEELVVIRLRHRSPYGAAHKNEPPVPHPAVQLDPFRLRP